MITHRVCCYPRIAMSLLIVRAATPQAPNNNLLTASELFKKVSPAVALIELEDGNARFQGSGFIVSSDGKILTNYHVIVNAKTATVRLANGDTYDTVEVIDIDRRKDIALLKIKAVDLPYVSLGKSADVEIGATVFAISNPEGLKNTLSQGLISAVREGDGFRLFQMSAPISHGSSGGPVFNNKGEVIAIAKGGIDQGQNLNFSIPIDYARGMLSTAGTRPLTSVYDLPSANTEHGTQSQSEVPRVAGSPGRRAPGFSLPEPLGTQRDPQDYRGKILIVDFMQVNCEHCVAFSAVLEQAKAKYGDKIAILSIVNPPSDAKGVTNYIAQHKIKTSILFDCGQVAYSYLRPSSAIITIPHVFVIDGDGFIRSDFAYGPNTMEIFEGRGLFTEIDKLMAVSAR
jgi:peroxiredoxin